GIRDFHVTGVQTCALPDLIVFSIIILPFYSNQSEKKATRKPKKRNIILEAASVFLVTWIITFLFYYLSNIDRTISSLWLLLVIRSEERRVGKECRVRLLEY